MRKLTLSLAVMAALSPTIGYPLGLGDIELNSALNQELNAEIEVMSATPEDAEQLIVKLASRDAFNRAGIDRPFLLQQLKFKVVEKNGKPVVRVYTQGPVREPYLNFLLEIDWPKGNLLREYTLLLDPPIYDTGTSLSPAQADSAHPFIDPADAQAQSQSGFVQQQPAQSAQGAAYDSGQVAPASAPATSTAVITSDTGRSVSYQYQPLPQATTAPAPGQYRVQQNDTLWSIANRMRPDSSVSVEQMMLALVRKNPEAFIQENINGVKRGYILRTPSRDEATQISRQDAVAQAREHASLWREYSQASVSAAPASSLEAEDQPAMTMDAPSRDVEGQLSIVGAGDLESSEFAGANQDPTSELARLRQQLAMAQEQLESERLEKEDLRSKLSDLETRVQRVIEMDDGELAQLQQDLQQTQAPAEDDAASMPAEEEMVAEEPVIDEAPAEDVAVDEMAAEDIVAEDMAEDVADVATDEAAMADEEAVFVDETTGVEEAVEPAADTSVSQVEPVQPIEPPAFAQKKPKSFIESLMDDPKMLGILGGGLALLLMLVLLLKRLLGGKKEEELVDELSELDNLDSDATVQADLGDQLGDMDSTTEMMAEPAADELGMEDTQIEAPDELEEDLEESVFSLDDTQELPAAETEEKDKDDVLAEADVYLAYGIYQQAEDLLNKAIDQNPDRDDYRLKLLETHFAAKNAPAFEQLAQDVKTRKSGDQAYWSRVAAMGMELCPDSAVFSDAGDMLAGIDTDALLPETPEKTDLDIDAGEAAAAELSDLGLGDDLGMGDDLAMTETTDNLDLDTDLDGGLGDLDTDLGADLDSELDLGDSGLGETALEEATEEVGELDMDLADQLETISTEMGDEVPDVSEPAAEADMSLDLGEDLDTGLEESLDMGTDDLDMDEDFSLDFEASDLGFEETDEAEEAEPAAEMELDADLDLGDIEEPAAEVGGEEIEMDLTGELDLGDSEDAEIDLGGELDLGDDLDLGEAEIDLGEAEAEVSLDMDDAGLDLGEDLDLSAEAATAEAPAEVSLDMDDDSEFDISELSEDVDEVSTKLDLARAYIDMGDNEGARSILEEVKAEGNDEQQQQADELLQQAS